MNRLSSHKEREMLAMHAICRMDGGRPANLENVDPKTGLYASGWWRLTPEQCESLVGGWMYFHDSSSRPATFASRVEGVGRRNDEDLAQLLVRRQPKAGQGWRGLKAGQSKTSHFRIVPADRPEEQAG